MITPLQCKAARVLLEWSQKDLHKASKVSVHTISNFENKTRGITAPNLLALERALEEAGIEFLADIGVTMKKSG